MASELVLRNGFPGHFWCENCEATKPIRLHDLPGLDVSQRFTGGDIICMACDKIIATYGFPVKAEAPNPLRFRQTEPSDGSDRN